MALSEEMNKQGAWLFRHRGQLPLVLLAAGLAVYIYGLETGARNTSGLMEVISFMTSLCGLAIRILSIGFSAQGTSGRNTKEQVAEQLNTSGMYSVVRHPLYVGNFLLWLGICIFVGNIWFVITFVLVYWIYYERIMLAEEEFLTKKFGEQYIAWAKQTPAFIPNVSRWKKPGNTFNYKEIFKREYNGLFSLAAVYILFDCTGDYVSGKEIFSDKDDAILLVFFASTFIILAICKFLKAKTHLLD